MSKNNIYIYAIIEIKKERNNVLANNNNFTIIFLKKYLLGIFLILTPSRIWC